MKRKFFIVVLVLISGFSIAESYSSLELFAQALNLIKKYYYRPVKTDDLVYGAIKGLLKETDSHSWFFTPEELEDFRKITDSQFFGIGIEIEKKDGFLIIIALVENSPAQKVGFKIGDKILKVNGKTVKNFTVDEFSPFFKAEQKKTYEILILREFHPKPLTFSVKSEKIKFKTVTSKDLGESFLYIRISQFSKNALYEINQLLRGKKRKGLLLDLRNNPGGILEQAVHIADLFIDKGIIVSYKSRVEEKEKQFLAHLTNTLEPFPIVILIDEYSASASEILAGALKDHKKAFLVGRRSFGKGTIQTLFQLKKGYAIKLTVGEYKTPSGKFIQGKGIRPHVILAKKEEDKIEKKDSKIPWADSEISQAFSYLKKMSKTK